MNYLGLWSPGLRKTFWKICKTLRSPFYILNVRSLIRQITSWWDVENYLLVYKLFEFVFESVSAIRNNNANIIFISKYHSHYCSFWEENQVQSVYLQCYISLQSVVQIKQFLKIACIFCWNPQKKRKKLTKKTIRYKLGGSSKMHSIFLASRTFKTFQRKLSFFWKSWHDATTSRGWEDHFICVIILHYVQNLICESPLIIKFLLI